MYRDLNWINLCDVSKYASANIFSTRVFELLLTMYPSKWFFVHHIILWLDYHFNLSYLQTYPSCPPLSRPPIPVFRILWHYHCPIHYFRFKCLQPLYMYEKAYCKYYFSDLNMYKISNYFYNIHKSILNASSYI